MARVTVIFFATARDRMKTGEAAFEVREGSTIDDLYREHLARGLASPIDHWRFAVNQGWASRDQVLGEGDEVAVIPPLSGG